MTDREYLYTVLMEECGEATQAAAKILRFGENTYNPFYEYSEDNALALLTECFHILAVAEMLQERGYLPRLQYDKDTVIKLNKKRKVEEYLDTYLKQQEK